MGIDSAHAGRSVKCPCGNIFKVAGSVPTPPASGPAQPTATSATSPAQTAQPSKPRPAGKPSTPAPAIHQPSFLDQLTEKDFSRPSSNPYDPPTSHSNSEASVLRKYVGADVKSKAEQTVKTSNGNITFLAVLNFIGATVYIGLGVVILILSSVLGTVADVLPLAALGALFAGILFFFGVFDLISGIGLIKRTFWGWWLCVVGLSWAFFDRGFGVAVQMMNTQDWTNEIPKAIGAAMFMFSSIYFLQFMCQKRTMKMFKVDVHQGVAWAIAISLGLLFGGFGFGLALYAAQGAETAL